MALLNFIIWDGNPEIVSFTLPFLDFHITLRWYGLLFALGFLLSQQILYYIFRKEGKPEKDVDTLTIYMVVATVIGARLGHVLFYEPARYLSNPIDILKIWEGGLASHGAAAGILFALWLYTRKRKAEGQSYLQTLDRIVILVALTGALIRLGNFFNSEIIGKETNSDSGVVFARHVSEMLKSDGYVETVSYIEDDTASVANNFPAVKILLQFYKGDNSREDYATYLNGRVNSVLTYSDYVTPHIYQPKYINYRLGVDESGRYNAIIYTHAKPRHPAQLYESISCILLFGFLLWLWSLHKSALPSGRLFGIFLIVCFGLRFVYEFLKENQVDFENDLMLNMGQLLSIPLVLFGIFVLVRSYSKKEDPN